MGFHNFAENNINFNSNMLEKIPFSRKKAGKWILKIVAFFKGYVIVFFKVPSVSLCAFVINGLQYK